MYNNRGYRQSSQRPYNGRQYYRRPKKTQYTQTKKLVTGHGPTVLEQIASGVGSVAKLAGAVAPVIAAINTELKYSDYSNTSLDGYNPGTSDQIVCLTNQLSQGTEDFERIGNSVLAKDITIKYNGLYLATTSNNVAFSRIVIFVWKDNATANAPTAAKLFETPATFLSAFNKDYTDQMVILKDKVYCHQTNYDAGAGGLYVAPIHEKIYKKLDFHMRWTNASTANSQNHVYMCVRGSGATSSNASRFQVYSRLNFTDN